MTVIFLNSRWRTAAILENVGNAITRLLINPVGREFGGRITSCPGHVRHEWCGFHGNGRCFATAHWIFNSCGRLEADSVNQFWWNMVHNSKFGTQWQSRDQIWKVLKFKLADGRHMEKCWKCYNSPTSGPSWTKLRWWHPVISATCSPWCSYHGNGRCLATVHWTFNSCGRLEVELVIQFWWNLEPTLSITVLHRSFTPGWKHTIITNPSHFCYCPQPGLPSRIIGLCTGRLMLIGLF